MPFKGTKNKKEVFKLLQSKGFTSLNELKKNYGEAFKVKSTEIVTENNDNNTKEDVLDYDYLMNMNIWSLTHEKVNELEETIKNQSNEYEFLVKNKPEDLWIKDLEEFINAYKKIVNNLDEKNREADSKIKENKSKVKTRQKRRNKKANSDISSIASKTKSFKKTKKKAKDSFIASSEDVEYLESVYSSSSSVSSEDDMSEGDGDYTIYPNKNNQKQKQKTTTKKQEKVISLDEEEEESDIKNRENKNLESNLKIERIKKSLTQSEQNILAEIGVKKIKDSLDKSKLTLRERLALRVAQGNLGTLANKEYKIPNKVNINNNNELKKDLDIKEVEEILDDDFLGKKTKTSTQKNSSNKKDGKASTKKKKIVEDSEDLDDEEFKL